MGERLSLAVAVLVAGSACLQSHATRCGDLWCPEGLACAPDQTRCVPPADVTDCAGLAEGAACRSGFCVGQVCTKVVCGDGLRVGPEVCDDGNTASCDGCSADCLSTETCGNGIVDCAEQCDDGAGNSGAPNANCRLDCRRQRCGDGVVDDASGEDCDGAAPVRLTCDSLGYYQGALGCSTVCRAEVHSCSGSCGDGVVNGPETCDGAPPGQQTCLDFGFDVGNLACGAQCAPSFATCERLGFRPMPWSGSGLYLNATWGTSADDVWAAGYQGQLLHWDGGVWAAVDPGSSATFMMVSGLTADDFYVVGRSGTVLHHHQGQWWPEDAGTTAQLNTVWVDASGQAFAAGHAESQPDGSKQGAVFVSAGDGQWVRWALPDTVNGAPRITSLWGTSPTDVYATAVGAILHFDGHAWTTMVVPPFVETNLTFFYALWGSGPRDVFAVGEAGTILHWDGAAWSAMASTTTSFLNAVDGAGPDDVWVVGDQGVALHYDGRRWAAVPTGTSHSLNGVTVRGQLVVAAGPGSLVRYDRGTPTLSREATGMTGTIAALWASGPADLFGVSTHGELSHFDGRAWTSVGVTADDSLWSLWGAQTGEVFAVGSSSNLVRGTPGDGGLSWLVEKAPIDVTFNWVWGSSAKDVWAVGASGAAFHFDGQAWQAVDVGTSEDLYGAWGSGPGDVYLVGSGGLVLHAADGGWAALDAGLDSTIWGAWGSGPADVYFFADAKGVVHWDGTVFSPVTTRSAQSFNFGSGSGPTNAFAVEYAGQGLFHTDGVDWTTVRVPAVGTMSVFSLASRTWVGTDNGEVLTLDTHCAARETDCEDRWDNDCDGLLNCQDPDCASAPACAAGGQCASALPASCGTSLSGSTAGGHPLFERYGCPGAALDGRERVYRLVPAATGTLTVSLEGADGLAALVLGSSAGACEPLAACLGRSGLIGARVVSAPVRAGEPVFLVVDGAGAATGDFTLTVECR